MMTLEVRGDGETPSTDLGYLLHKHPDRMQSFDTSQGTARVFYPRASAQECRVALHVDGEGVRSRDEAQRHVSTIPYAASSRFVVAIGKVFGDALAGRCARPELVEHSWPIAITVPSVPVGGALGPDELFTPLGWSVGVSRQPLAPSGWGDSPYATVTLEGRHTVRDALRHLCVLLPVIADDKHYFVDELEIDKLERLGDGWLSTHPHRDRIISGYVKRVRPLVDLAVDRLTGADPIGPDTADSRVALPQESARQAGSTVADRREGLARRRLDAVVESVRAARGRSVLDLGCGEGRLLDALAADGACTRLAGVDVSVAALRRAAERLERRRDVDLWQSSLMYGDTRCRGFDVAVLMEVIEHIDQARLPVAVASVFDGMAPATVVVTTPNRDHNSRYGLGPDEYRHPDHRFEFTRAEFARWCADVADEYRYTVVLGEIGDPDAEVGAPTQSAVFTRIDEVSR
ncbi:3' terminal RNA ribose 2'-O-methyltransferase Hen1 [Gordonia sp. OPL2]|uniref:3' terminal RNA ribose 2'-O-methyltransferase Hen1 n=1 Tax=Gordonia sp. OPL2 TaxID=2486274 RepID=UPI001654E4B2|nr:3' terminal RNA ribose 2'-O-methyltransferase Hen1 [Gordonia sp. OPL2]